MFKKLPNTLLVLLTITLLLGGCKAKKKSVNYTKKPKNEAVVKNTPTPVKEDPKPVVTPKVTPVKVVKTGTYEEVVSNYVYQYAAIAKEEMLQYGIPASITLAQGILESGAGRGELSNRANNHFGIKCHTSWEGERVYHDDDEAQECFRKYKDPKYSYRDHSLFLTGRSRYATLFKLGKDDYKGWARGLKKAGYATDPKYPNKLISIIERYNLQQFDEDVLGNGSSTITKSDNSKISSYTVKKGDTLYSISRKFNIPVDSLKNYNGLTSNALSIGQALYLHSVKN